MPVAALERLDVVAAPAPSQVAPLEAVLSAVRNTIQALEASQASAFGAQVDTPPTTSMPHGSQLFKYSLPGKLMYSSPRQGAECQAQEGPCCQDMPRRDSQSTLISLVLTKTAEGDDPALQCMG